MTPEQIKLCVQLAIAAALLAGAAWCGWAVNGWRLGEKVAQVEAERDRALDQAKVLAASTQACSDGVELARTSAKLAIDSTAGMLTEARKLRQGGETAVARVEDLLKKPPPAGADCNAAWAEIEQARKARAAP